MVCTSKIPASLVIRSTSATRRGTRTELQVTKGAARAVHETHENANTGAVEECHLRDIQHDVWFEGQ